MKSDLQFLFAAADGNEITIREGKALELKEPCIVSVSGVLDSPLKWLQKRILEIDEKLAHIRVNREQLQIELTIDETSFYACRITGSLELHSMFKLFAVNTGRSLSNFDMAKLFKMNRSAFENHSVAMDLVTVLQNFKAKVERDLEKADNNRGDRRLLVAQTVQSNLPDKFNLCMPIFKGTKKQTFEVEVYINADDFSCSLISPIANDLIEGMRDLEIDAVLDEISELAPGIVIIEQ